MPAPLVVIVSLILVLLAAPLDIEAQEAGKVYRIGMLYPTLPAARWRELPARRAFVDELAALGYVEGRNVVFEVRSGEGQADRYPGLATELVARKPDMLVTPVCGAPLNALRQATRTIPIVVFTCQDDMVAIGVAASLARPGGNITGISKASPEWGAKKLQLLKEAVPATSRVAVFWDPTYTDWSADWRELRAAAQSLGVTLESIELRGPGDLDRALTAILATRVQAVISFSDVGIYAYARRVGEFAAANRLAWMSPFREITAAGGLLSYGPNLLKLVRHSATFVAKILKGAKPADLPIEQPTTFELMINLKTAKALGLTIPQSVMLRADEVIE